MPVRLTARTALAATGMAFVCLVATWFAAFHVGFAQRADQSILLGFFDVADHRGVTSLANFVANLCNPVPYVFFAWIPMIVAVIRGRPLVALAIGVILVGANVTTHELKPLLATPRPFDHFDQIGSASWPSGHATAAMSFVLCCVLAAPNRMRPFVVAIGAMFAVAVCYSFLALGWHYPSDVLGGFLVATTWTLLAISGLRAIQKHGVPAVPASRPRLAHELGPPAAAVAAAAGLGLLLALARPHAVLAFARAHEWFVLGAAGIGLIALALATGLMLAVRR
ncbi:MAG: phosphatase PAP2 family protein [Solirubrobacteraceae bacterium]